MIDPPNNTYKCPYCEAFSLQPDEDEPDRAVYQCLICAARFTYSDLCRAEQMTPQEIYETFRPRISWRAKAAFFAAVFTLSLILFFVLVMFI